MRLQFGNTWWGAKWVNSIGDATYDNRLPRGKTYARNGSVRNIEIQGMKIEAKVQGSRSKPYDVTVSLKPFSQKEKKTVLDIIIGNSAYLSALLVRRLPEKLFDDCASRQINIFPKQWKDFNADCSCPDWADCCKHIAAVIYLIGNEIDRNPFLSFLLHGLDILKELEVRSLTGSQVSEKSKIQNVSELFQNEKKTKSALIKAEPWHFADDIFGKLNFTTIPECRERLFALLPSNPLFGTGKDFKIILAAFYKNLQREIKKMIYVSKEEKQKNIPLTSTENFVGNVIQLNSDFSLNKISFASPGRCLEANNMDSFFDLIDFALQIPLKTFHLHEKTLLSFSLITQFALHIIEKGAFIPEILKYGNDQDETFFIRYIPALNIPEISTVFDQIFEIIPENLIHIENPSLKISKAETLKIIFSFIVKAASFYGAGYEKSDDAKIENLFLKGMPYHPKSFHEREIPDTIHLWLSRFHLQKADHAPVLAVEEKGDDFQLDLFVENKKKQITEVIPFRHLFTKKAHASMKFGILKTVELLREYLPELMQLLESEGKEKPVISAEKFPHLFFTSIPILRLLQIGVLLPKGLQELLMPKLTVLAKKKKNQQEGKGYLSLESMMEFDWKIAMGDQEITFDEFMKLVKNGMGIVKFHDRYVYLDEKEMQKLMKQFQNPKELSAQEKLQTIFAGEYDGTPIILNSALKKEIEKLLKIESIKPPKALLAQLRPYQQRGYEWLYKNANIGFGSLIADDMGLGKTVQVISLLLALKAEKRLQAAPVLVIAPTTLLTNWAKELSKFAPDLSFDIYHGSQRKFDIKGKNILLTSYSLARKDFEKFEKIDFSAIVLDEAQNIKNPDTDQARAVKKLRANIRIAMTGTPVENRLSEYWSIFDFLNKGYLGNYNSFREHYAMPIEKDRDHRKLERFQKVTRPFILRRLKSDKNIIKDLPDKVSVDQYCDLNKEQAALYQGTLENIMQAIESSEGIARKGLVLKLITALKQICNHPAHYLKKKESAVDLSGKTALLMEILETIYENGEKVLIFSQYTAMGELLSQMIAKHFQEESLFFHGGLTRKKRDEMVEIFQTQPHIKTMILSLKAGGVGLNLTAAKNVIHFDLWWNPAVENQATDRAYRIGQKENVMVHRLITKGTFEEKINTMIQDKKDLADLTVIQGEKWVGEWNNKELRDIFELKSTKT